MQRRCDRNRKRSKRRAIYCPIHGCYLDSVSQKHPLFADRAGQLQKRGINRRDALILVSSKTAVPIDGEWLEAFWCDHCQQTKWYYVKKQDRVYRVTLATKEMWQQATGVTHPDGNAGIGEFTRRQARFVGRYNCKDFLYQR